MKTTNLTPQPSPQPSRVRSYADDFISKQEVAKRLHRSTRFIEKLMHRGLPYYRVGRFPMFRWDEVKEYFATHTRACKGQPVLPRTDAANITLHPLASSRERPVLNHKATNAHAAREVEESLASQKAMETARFYGSRN